MNIPFTDSAKKYPDISRYLSTFALLTVIFTDGKLINVFFRFLFLFQEEIWADFLALSVNGMSSLMCFSGQITTAILALVMPE